MGTLGQKQERFSKMFSSLLFFYEEHGYEVRIGDVWAHDLNFVCDFLISIQERDLLPEELKSKLQAVMNIINSAKHKRNSCHYLKLAADLNLFKDGRFLTRTEDHQIGGEFWESQGGFWGGHFDDGNHYSLKNGIYK